MLDLYLKYKFMTDFIIPLLIVLLIVIFVVYRRFKFNYSKISKKNCFDCTNYKLKDVASVGEGCSYKCDVFKNINKHSMNDRCNFVKCDKFEKK